MKTFLQKLEDESKTKKPVVMAFGRMNPPTIGHEKLVNKVKEIAKDYNAPHHVIVSHSMDTKKNPLDVASKIKHTKRFFPNTNIEAASKEQPTFLQHAARLNAAGHDHLVMVAGSDRVPEYEQKLKQYNGTHKGALYNFKKIEVKSAGQRDPDAEGAEGMSASKMREHAKNNDFTSFKQGIPAHVPEKHSRELFRDVRNGMGLNENVDRSLFKAIFVTGGPGSGKDIVIRECIAEMRAVELNTKQAYDILNDKHSLSHNEAFRNRSPLIINGPADDQQRMLIIKEELEELGYDTLMVFVDTSNEISQERNEKLTKSITESVRYEKWSSAQSSKKSYSEDFEYFLLFDNSASLPEIEESVTDTYQIINMFLEHKSYKETAINWMERNGKININESFNLMFEEPDAPKNSKSIQRKTVIKYNPSFGTAKGPTDIKPDNRPGGNPAGKEDSIKGDTFPRKDPNGKGHSGGAWSGAYSTEETKPTVSIKNTPKEANFKMDNDKKKVLKRGDTSLSAARVGKPSGLGSEYDTRAGGQSAAAGAGLGQNLYGENVGATASNDDVVNFAGTPGVSVNPLDSKYQPVKFNKFRNKIKEAIDDPGAVDMGVGGTLGGAGNKEGMDSYKDQNRNIGIQIKKKKKQEK